MKKSAKISLILIFSTIVMLGLLYTGLAYYYRYVFPYGTFINNVYCTGLTVAEAADEMNAKAKPEVITVTMPHPFEDNVYEILSEDLAISYDYYTPLKQYMDMQNPFLWIDRFGSDSYDEVVPPEVYFDEDKCREIVGKWNVSLIGSPHTVSIEVTDEGYILHNNKEHPDEKACSDKIIEAIHEGLTDIRLDDTCVITPAYSSTELATLKQYEALERFADKNITLHLDGEDVSLNKDEIHSLLAGEGKLPDYDVEADEVIYTKESVADGLYDLLSPYNTYNNHDFTTHDGRKVHLTLRTLGNSIDVESAVDELYEALKEGKDTIDIEPKYKHQMDENEKEYVKDIGNTYIEISLDEQHMYYYEKGKLKLDTNVVTGKLSTGSGTKEGVYYIYYMQRNRTLVGETYRSFVNYWMAFNRHVGIHDATWRTQWGEDAYRYAGSHGCVNTPFDKAAELYDYAYVGMPVIVYSYEKSEITK